MKTDRREHKIISLLESRGEMTVNDFSRVLDVSLSTLRKQLAVMQSKGLVIRTYGGVMPVNRVPDETFDSKLHKNMSEKRRIAVKARTMINSVETISLGSGTTVFELSNLLADIPHGIIYTNSMQAADYLARCAGLEVHICSGVIRSHTGTIIGNEAAAYFKQLPQVDYAFIGCDAIDSSGDVYSENMAVALVEKTVLLNAKHKYILCDSSKIGKTAVAHIVNLRECDGIVTANLENGIAENFKFLTEVIYA